MSIPYIPLYVTDYEADTAHLTMEEDGAYMRLLRLCWRTPGCSVPDEPKWIMRKMRISADDYYRVVEPLIDEFFTRGMDRVFSGRLQTEHERVEGSHKQRSDAGKASAKARALKTKEKVSNGAKFPLQQLELEPELEPDKRKRDTNVSLQSVDSGKYSDSFEDWWKLYPRKAAKGAAFKAFDKARKKVGDDLLFSALEQQRVSLDREQRREPGKNFCPYPASWLNAECYNDEPPERTISKSSERQAMYAEMRQRTEEENLKQIEGGKP